jgi:hypothetical protein
MRQYINLMIVDFFISGLLCMIPLARQDHLQDYGGKEHQADSNKSSAFELDGTARLAETR